MATTTTVSLGASKTLKATFKNRAGVVIDPTAITLTILEPDGTTTTKAIGDLTLISTGIYEYDFPVTQAGRHFFHWDGDTAVEAATQGEFYGLTRGAV